MNIVRIVKFGTLECVNSQSRQYKDVFFSLLDREIDDGFEIVHFDLDLDLTSAIEVSGYRGGLVFFVKTEEKETFNQFKYKHNIRYVSDNALEIGACICEASRALGYQDDLQLVGLRRNVCIVAYSPKKTYANIDRKTLEMKASHITRKNLTILFLRDDNGNIVSMRDSWASRNQEKQQESLREKGTPLT